MERRVIKQIVDLSMPLRSMDTPVFPGSPQPVRSTFQSVKEDGYLSYIWSFSEHTATHVDAPAHMIEGGEPVDAIPLKHFVGEGLVVDLSKRRARRPISGKELREALSAAGEEWKTGKGRILLIQTGQSAKSRTPQWLEYPDFTEEACKVVIEKQFVAVGFDSPSPDRPPFVAHKTLLPKRIVIFENLANLERVKGKRFVFVGVPLALVGGSASPCRAIALVL